MSGLVGGFFGGGKKGTAKATAQIDPVISSFRVQTSAYGLVIPLVYGRSRVSGNLLWYGYFQAISHTEVQSGGGGGGTSAGKGGGSVSTPSSSRTWYEYRANILLGLCEGPITEFLGLWAEKSRTGFSDYMFYYRFLGTYPQTPFWWLTTYMPAQALPYPGLAYVASTDHGLTEQATLPNYSFEIVGRLPFSDTIRDSNPADIIPDFLSNQHYGAGFPAGKIGDLSSYRNYCTATGIFLSPVLTDQIEAQEFVNHLCLLTNSVPLWSEDRLRIVPLGDQEVSGHGVTWTPNLTPVYDLTDDDFIADADEDPLVFTRKNLADAYNQVKVEIWDRGYDYNTAIIEAPDAAHIKDHGRRPMDQVEAHAICSPEIGRTVAQLLLQKNLAAANTYEFKVSGWKYCLLEPLDLITLTDPVLGLDKHPVRILSIQENDDFTLTITAEDFLAGVGHASLYPSQGQLGYSLNANVAPGLINPPCFFEPPALLTDGKMEVWGAVSGGDNWGGCEIWASLNGDTYKFVDRINAPSRYGWLRSPLLASGGDIGGWFADGGWFSGAWLDSILVSGSPDTVSTLEVELYRGKMFSGTLAETELKMTICYVGGDSPEYLAYQNATLVGVNQYDLTYLVRGLVGTPISQHPAGSKIVRLDDAIFRYPLTPDLVGQTLAIKFLSFNIFGGARQLLEDVEPHYYQLTGLALKSPLPDVQNFTTVYRDGHVVLVWDPVEDFRRPDYEVRKGNSWETAIVLGRTPLTEFATRGTGVYWVAAHSEYAYSGNPASIEIEGADLVANVVASWDEAATGWLGLKDQVFVDPYGKLQLGGSMLFSAIPLVSAVLEKIAYLGGLAPAGTYEIPAAHEVDVGAEMACNLSANLRAVSFDPYSKFSEIPLVSACPNIAGVLAGLSHAKVQLALAPATGIYGDWQDFVPGQFVARKFKFRLLLQSFDPQVGVLVDGFDFIVDMPDRLESAEGVLVPASGLVVTYEPPFVNKANVQITIIAAQAGDDAELIDPDLSGFTVRIKNAGEYVERRINWFSQGY